MVIFLQIFQSSFLCVLVKRHKLGILRSSGRTKRC